jgi:hypothetical protein
MSSSIVIAVVILQEPSSSRVLYQDMHSGRAKALSPGLRAESALRVSVTTSNKETISFLAGLRESYLGICLLNEPSERKEEAARKGKPRLARNEFGSLKLGPPSQTWGKIEFST